MWFSQVFPQYIDTDLIVISAQTNISEVVLQLWNDMHVKSHWVHMNILAQIYLPAELENGFVFQLLL